MKTCPGPPNPSFRYFGFHKYWGKSPELSFICFYFLLLFSQCHIPYNCILFYMLGFRTLSHLTHSLLVHSLRSFCFPGCWFQFWVTSTDSEMFSFSFLDLLFSVIRNLLLANKLEYCAVLLLLSCRHEREAWFYGTHYWEMFLLLYRSYYWVSVLFIFLWLPLEIVPENYSFPNTLSFVSCPLQGSIE